MEQMGEQGTVQQYDGIKHRLFGRMYDGTADRPRDADAGQV
jgi:hypothetical protein